MKRAVFINNRDEMTLEDVSLFAGLGYDTVVLALDALREEHAIEREPIPDAIACVPPESRARRVPASPASRCG